MNLDIWEKVRGVPQTAIKPIEGGRLKGMSDINPMWRLKALTEQFGICGIGWKYEITEKKLERSGDEVAAFVDINLYIKVNSEWSAAIPGTGGSSFVAKERSGLYMNDECYKMALTDAISVACKALGVGADVYWNKDKTKYSNTETTTTSNTINPAQAKRMFTIAKGNDQLVKQVLTEYGHEKTSQVKWSEYEDICGKIEILAKEQEEVA